MNNIVILLSLVIMSLKCAQCANESHYVDIYPNVTLIPLYFGLMLSLSGDQQSNGALAGVQAALDDINSRDDLLPGYLLHYTLTDSQCNRTVALDGLFTQLFQPPQEKVALIGSGCSIATEATAEISHYYDIVQISCASSSDGLSNGVRFPYYFQLLPSEVNLARVFYSIIKEYGWRRVALIVQNEHRYKKTQHLLMDMLSDSMIAHVETYFDNIEKLLGNDKVFDLQFRVYVIAMNSKYAVQLLCKAHRLGMKYPKYVFLTYGSHEPHWWTAYSDKIECSPDDIADVLQYSLAATHFNALSEGKLFYHHCYDATWALAYVLNNTLDFSEEWESAASASGSTCGPGTDSAYSFRNRIFTPQLMKQHLEATNFVGTTGLVHFDKNGIRILGVHELRVLQYRTTYLNGTPIFSESLSLSKRLKLIEVAYLNNESLEFLVGDNNDVWPGRTVPYDGEPIEKIVTVSIFVTATLTFLNTCGIICAVICLLFNFFFRNKRLIRLNSPNLNYLILVGAIVVSVGSIIFVAPVLDPKALPALCIIRAGLLAIGHSVGFGTVIAKLWRIFIIFRNPQNTKRRRGIKDWHLVLLVLGLVVVDIAILTIYLIAEGVLTHFTAGKQPNAERQRAVQGELDFEIVYATYTCSQNPWIRTSFVSLIFLYKGALQICALYFAFQTRKVKIEGLNDAKYIAAFVYTSSIVVSVTSISSIALTRYINVYAVVYSFGVWFGNIAMLGFLFLPKMVSLYKDPDGDKVFEAHNEALEGQTTLQKESSDVESLKQRIKQLEDELTKN